MVATNKGYVEEVDALLEGGADVNATHKVNNSHINHYSKFVISSQETGWTAIFFAAKNGNIKIIQILLYHNAKTELDVSCKLSLSDLL